MISLTAWTQATCPAAKLSGCSSASLSAKGATLSLAPMRRATPIARGGARSRSFLTAPAVGLPAGAPARRVGGSHVGGLLKLPGMLTTGARSASAIRATREPEDAEVVAGGELRQELGENFVSGMGKMGILMSLTLAGFALPGLGNLQGPGSVGAALGVLAAIIAVHEYGHFLAARLQNIHVTKFSIGFGPVLAKYQGPQVEYAVRAIPLGGFVAFPDDDPGSVFDDDDPNLLKNRPVSDRMWVVSAGVIANVIFAFTVLLTQVSTVGVLDQVYKPGVAVPEILSVSAAGRAGVQTGDVIKSVNGRDIGSSTGSVRTLVNEIKGSAGKDLNLVIERKAPAGAGAGAVEQVAVTVVPDTAADGGGRIGVQLSSNVENRRKFADGPLQACGMAFGELGRLTQSVTQGLTSLVTNFAANKEQVSGPVAILAVGAEVARNDSSGLFQYAAILNINLAVVNALPLPALDGGYALLLAIEALRGGKKLPDGLETAVMSSGFLLLMGSGIFLVVRDTLNLDFIQAIIK